MPFDDAQKSEINALITAGLKEAIGGTDFTKQLAGVIKTQVTGAVKGLKIEDTVTTAVTAAVTAAMKADDGKGGGDNDGKGKGDETPEMKKLAAEVRKLTEQVKTSDTARDTAETARQVESLLNAARTALGKAGVSADRIPHALAVIHDAGGRLAFTDGENPVAGMKFTRDWGEEIVSMQKGAEEWVGTADGKHFLPASGVTGTGDGAGHKKGAFKTSGGKLDVNKAGGALLRRHRQGQASDAGG